MFTVFIWRAALIASALLIATAVLLVARAASAREDEKLGYPEPVLHWIVEPGETCAAVSQALYDSTQHVELIHRYNEVRCDQPLPVGRLLVLPLEIREVPVARLEDVTPVVRARPPEGAWVVANRGMTFAKGYGVNTLAQASAELLFRDNSRVVLRENTLVVIYEGSAVTTKGRSPGVSVAVDDGELRAAMASLQSRPVHVLTGEGSEVRVSGRDAAVRHRGGRTAVSVFDGEATVSSAAEAVYVPAEHGTTFFDRAPPWKPKKLLPAPAWKGAPTRLLGVRQKPIGTTTHRTFSLFWHGVSGAAGYRLELARDAAFRRVLLQEEVPPSVQQVRFASLPVGAFHLRVQAVDADGLLGLPSVSRVLSVVSLTGDAVPLGAERFAVSAYASLRVSSGPGLSLRPHGAEPVDETTIQPHLGEGLPSITVVGEDDQGLPIAFEPERPTVQLHAQWLPSAEPRVKLRAQLKGRAWPGGETRLGGLSQSMWDTAGFRWVVVQGDRRGLVSPQADGGLGWIAEVNTASSEPLSISWEDARGVVLGQVKLGARVDAPGGSAAKRWEPFALRLPYTQLPRQGIGTGTGATLGLLGASDGLGATGFITAFGQLSTTWSLAAEWTSGVGGGLGPEDQGSVTAYAAEALNEHWHIGIHGGLRLPFFLDGSRVQALSGFGLEGAWSNGWRLLTSLGVDSPIGHGGREQTATQYLMAVGWFSPRYPVRCFIGLQGRQNWTRAPEKMHGATFVGLETGVVWRGGVTARLSPTSSAFGPQLAVQTTLTRLF